MLQRKLTAQEKRGLKSGPYSGEAAPKAIRRVSLEDQAPVLQGIAGGTRVRIPAAFKTWLREVSEVPTKAEVRRISREKNGDDLSAFLPILLAEVKKTEAGRRSKCWEEVSHLYNLWANGASAKDGFDFEYVNAFVCYHAPIEEYSRD